jgi:ATP-dependent protease ClpP protease subunit
MDAAMVGQCSEALSAASGAPLRTAELPRPRLTHAAQTGPTRDPAPPPARKETDSMTWYRIRNSADRADVEIRGPIEADTATRLVRDISSARAVRLTVASPGGDARAGLTIARALRAVPSSTAYVSLALSAAAVAVCGARRVTLDADGLMMLHSPVLVAERAERLDSAALRRATADLEEIKHEIGDVLAWKMNRPLSEIRELLDRETWFDAREAVAAGLADEIAAGAAVPIAACFDFGLLRRYTVPPRFRERLAAMSRLNTFSIYAARQRAHAARAELSETERAQITTARDLLDTVLTPPPAAEPAPAPSAKLNAFDVLAARARRAAAGGSR